MSEANTDAAAEPSLIESLQQQMAQIGLTNPPGDEPAQPASPPVTNPPAKPDAAAIKSEADQLRAKLVAKPQEARPQADQATFDDEPPKGASATTSAHWQAAKKKWSEKHAEAVREKDLLAQQIEQLKKSSAPSAELEAIKAEKQRLDDELKAVALERHPQFRNHFQKGMETALATARAIIPGEVGDQVAHLLSLPDSPFKNNALNQVVGDLNPLAQAQLGAVINDIRKLELEKAATLANASKTYDQMQQLESQRKAESEAQVKNRLESTFNQQLATAQKAGFDLLQTVAGDEKWNSEVMARISNAKAIMATQDPEIAARSAIYAAIAPTVIEKLQAATRLIELQDQQLQAFGGANPGVGGAGESKESSAADDNLSLIERISKTAETTGAFRGY